MTEAIEKSVFAKLISVFWEPSATFKSLKIKTQWFDIVLPILLVAWLLRYGITIGWFS